MEARFRGGAGDLHAVVNVGDAAHVAGGEQDAFAGGLVWRGAGDGDRGSGAVEGDGEIGRSQLHLLDIGLDGGSGAGVGRCRVGARGRRTGGRGCGLGFAAAEQAFAGILDELEQAHAGILAG